LRTYRVVAVPNGFSVAYNNPRGQLMAVSEHWERHTAQAEADELNRLHKAAIARGAERHSHIRNAALFGVTRRAVRQFSDAEGY
jgi:hypothetical protein